MNGEHYYAGMDIHKKNIAICLRKADGTIIDEQNIPATRDSLTSWTESQDQPFIAGMEATLFTAWIYDLLTPCAKQTKVGNPLRLKAISSSKHKNDKLDARALANLLRADLFPECYMHPPEIRDLRRVMRFRQYIVRAATMFKNKSAGLLMESGVQYNKKKLHRKGYFWDLLGSLKEVPQSVIEMLSFNRHNIETFEYHQRRLINELKKHPRLKERVRRLMTIPGVGEILALTWAVEIGDPFRFSSFRKVVSFVGLCSGQNASGGKTYRGPLSKQRNQFLQWALVEVANLAPRYNKKLAEVYDREVKRGNKNRATLAVARKLASYLYSVDRSGKDFIMN